MVEGGKGKCSRQCYFEARRSAREKVTTRCRRGSKRKGSIYPKREKEK